MILDALENGAQRQRLGRAPRRRHIDSCLVANCDHRLVASVHVEALDIFSLFIFNPN